MKFIRTAIGILLLALATGAVGGEREAQALSRIAQGALLVDVRTPGEFAAGHLTGAINIPYQQIVEALAQQQLDKDRDIVVYCRSGNRSGIAERMLQSAGYTAVFDGGGLRALQRQADQL